MEAWRQNLSRDGKKLAFCAKRAGKWELWEKSLVDGREAPIVADDYHRNFPVWSPDGTRLSYVREKYGAVEPQFMVWSGQNRNEEPLTASSTAGKIVYDWSADGTGLSGIAGQLVATGRKSGCYPWAPPRMRKQRRERSSPTQPMMSTNHTSLLMADGLSSKQ